jgi:hypothetical protein
LIRASSFSYLARRLHPSFKRLALNTGPAIHDPYYVFCVSRSPHPPSRDPSSPHTHTRARALETHSQPNLATYLATYLANLPGKLTRQTYLANLPGKLTWQTYRANRPDYTSHVHSLSIFITCILILRGSLSPG